MQQFCHPNRLGQSLPNAEPRQIIDLFLIQKSAHYYHRNIDPFLFQQEDKLVPPGGHLQIGQYQVYALEVHALQRRRGICIRQHLVSSSLEEFLNGTPDICVIIYYENRWHSIPPILIDQDGPFKSSVRILILTVTIVTKQRNALAFPRTVLSVPGGEVRGPLRDSVGVSAPGRCSMVGKGRQKGVAGVGQSRRMASRRRGVEAEGG